VCNGFKNGETIEITFRHGTGGDFVGVTLRAANFKFYVPMCFCVLNAIPSI
jgi:hypothetical protein